MSRLAIFLGFGGRIHRGLSWRSREFGQRFLDSVTGVIFRVRFVSGAVPCDSLDDRFGTVTTREGAFREGPIVLGLAQAAARRRRWSGAVMVVVTWRILGVDVQLEIAR